MDVSYIPIAKARGFTTHWITNTPLVLFPYIIDLQVKNASLII